MKEMTKTIETSHINHNFTNFRFFDRNRESSWTIGARHCACGLPISNQYTAIINKLKESKLLEEDYKLICCECKEIKETIGFIFCKKCGSNLNLLTDGSSQCNKNGCRVSYNE